MTKSAQIVFYILLAGIIGNILFLFMSQINMKGEYTESTVGGWYYTLAFVSNVLLSMVSVYSFVMYRHKFPWIVTACYLALLLLIFIASFNDLGMFSKQPSLFYCPKGIGTWINFGLLYFMAEEAYRVKLFRIFKIVCYAVVIFNFGAIALLGTISNRTDAENAIRDTTCYLIWVYPFFFFDETDKTTITKAFKYTMIIFVAFFAFAIASRSYLLIVIIYFLIKLKRDLKEGKNTILIVAMSGIMLLVGYYFTANIHSFNNIKGLLNIFSGRMDDDSRSSQLREFLDQYNYDKLFSGVGPSGTWHWSVYTKGGYEWLDNQFILATWWFGIITCLIYIAFLGYPIIRKNPNNDVTMTNAKIVIFFWILACAGFAIYVTFSTKLFYYFITFLIGYATLNVKEKTFLKVSMT